MQTFFNHQMDYIYFFYGLSFIIMAIACFTLEKERRHLLPWNWLVLFGVTHGINEWLDMIAFLIGGSEVFTVVRTLIMILSFIFICQFARLSIRRILGKGPGVWLILVLIAVVAISVAINGLSILSISGRYALGFPGAIATAYVLFLASKEQKKDAKIYLLVSSVVFGCYGVFAGLIVPPASFFPANIINDRLFFETFGLPVQLMRGLSATLVAISMALWSTYQVTPDEEQVGLEQIRISYVRRMVFALVGLVTIGWAATNGLEHYGERVALKNLLYRVSTIESAIIHNHLVKVLQSPDRIQEEGYQNLKQQLNDLVKSNNDSKHIYIVGITEEKPYILVSSDISNSLPEQNKTRIELPKNIILSRTESTAFYQRDNDVVSAFAPVVDPKSDHSIAFLGMSIDSHQFWVEKIAPYRLLAIFNIMVLCTLMLLYLWVLMKNHKSNLQITQLKMEAARLTEEKKWKYITSSLGEGVLVVNQQGIIEYVNPKAEHLLKWNEDELVGESIEVVCWLGDSELNTQSRVTFKTSEEIFTCRDGNVFPVASVYTPFIQDGLNVGSVIAFKDITEQKMAEVKIKYLAYYDSLTGLPNRSMFEENLNNSLNKIDESDGKLAVLFLDLDHFKLINETEGHKLGDEFLKVVANKLLNCINENQVVARLGGDEFAIMLPDLTEVGNAVEVSKRLLDMFRKPVDVGQRRFRTSVSIGVTIYPNDGDNAENLLRNADLAMYRAKERGRNTYELYDVSMDKQVKDRMQLENDLRSALQNKEFFIHYQPQVDCASKAIVGVEALLRWKHPKHGIIPPSVFIPFAEETGLIVPIGEWVLNTACAQNKAWQLKGYSPVKVAVNISTRQFEQKDFVEIIKRVLATTGLEPKYLEIEITESMAMQDFKNTNNMLKELKALGVNISIDDFGTGYASLSYLTHLAIDTLKIDISFINMLNSADDKASETLVKTVISLAKNLNLNTLAEGVETEEQFHILSQFGCDFVQGYLFYKPLPVHELESLMNRNLASSEIDDFQEVDSEIATTEE